MSLEPELRERISNLVHSKRVLLFMKGNREMPQCGFSATVIGILNGLLPDYDTFDVLSDPELRSGIKEFSEWPTIPQLYVDGEFLGGCDIVQEMAQSGELHKALGLEPPSLEAPSIRVTDEAAAVLRQAMQGREEMDLHLAVDARYQPSLGFGPRQGHEIETESNGIRLLVDPSSAPRANGITIHVAETDQGRGLTIDNPNAPQASPS